MQIEECNKLDQVLKFERCSSFSIQSDSEPLLYRNALEGSIQFIGCQALRGRQGYVICTRDGIHLFEGTCLKASHSFQEDCFSYLCIRIPGLTNGALHATFIDDGYVILFQIKDYKFEVLKRIEFAPSRLRVNRTAFMAAATASSICVCLDSQTIIQVDGSRQIYQISMGELLSFFFMGDGSVLVCLYRHKSTGRLYIETLDRSPNWCRDCLKPGEWASGSFCRHCSVSVKYVTSGKFDLKTANEESGYIKKLSEDYAVCVTSNYTCILQVGCSPFFFRNLGGLNLNDSVNVDGSISINKRSNLTTITLNVFDSSGTLKKASIELFSVISDSVKWTKSLLLSGQAFEPNELSFATEFLNKRNISYLIVSKLVGVCLITQNKRSKSVILPGQSKRVFDGNCIPSGGSHIDSYIFCGAFTESHGFIEKQTLQYSSELVKIISKQKLHHQPIANLWSTDDGLLYECMGTLYSTETNKNVRSFENGLWLTRNNVEINGVEEKVIAVSELTGSADGTVCCVSVISAQGFLKVLDIRSKERSELLLNLSLGTVVTQNAKCSVEYVDCYYTACYHGQGCLSFYRDTVKLGQMHIGLNWFLSDLLVKIADAPYVIITSMNGPAKVVRMDDGKCVLDISSASNPKFQLLDLGIKSDFVLLYSEHECILINLKEMVYGRLDFGFRPMKIIPRNLGDGTIFYALDNRWSLNVVEFSSCHDRQFENPLTLRSSDVFDLPDCVPIRILPFTKSSLAVILLKQKQKQKHRGQLTVILFDYNEMRVIDSQNIEAKYDNASNVLLQSFGSEIIPSEPMRIFLKRFFIVCCAVNGRSIIHIFRFNGCAVELLATELLPFLVLSITLVQDGKRVMFGGEQMMIYDLICDFENYKIEMSHEGNNKEGGLQCLKGPSFYYGRNKSGTAISFVGERCEINLPACNQTEVNTHTMSKRFGSNPIVKVATKRLLLQRESSSFFQFETHPVAYMKSSEIIKSLSGWNYSSPEGYYLVTVDCSGYVNLYKGRANKPEGRFRLHSRILNVSPIASQYRGLQISRSRWALHDTWPLFMISCEDGLTYTLSAHHKPEVGFWDRDEHHRIIILSF